MVREVMKCSLVLRITAPHWKVLRGLNLDQATILNNIMLSNDMGLFKFEKRIFGTILKTLKPGHFPPTTL